MTYTEADRARWAGEDPVHKRADRDDFARDRGRLIHSAALRRLAAKTQVVQPASDDFVRNRLTHTLEVAQIGREFGGALGCDGDVVEVACLAHDLGHPPFGHNGEAALDRAAADIGGFEGNAQTLRLLTRLEPKRVHPDGRPAGLNLTRASLDAATKYPWTKGEGPRPGPKHGAYGDDRPVFDWLREGAPAGVRCLEAEVMDWSDDVAYSVHDVEDAIASGHLDPALLRDDRRAGEVLRVARQEYAPDLSEPEVEAALARLAGQQLVPREFDATRASLAGLKDMTSRLIGRFVHAAEVATRERYGSGPLTRYAASLVVPPESRAEVAVLKGVAAHFVMQAEERVEVYVHQRAVIDDLLAWFGEDPEVRLDPALRADLAVATTAAARRRVVVDQVASLTDVRALALHARVR